jgi:hypothetical protein
VQKVDPAADVLPPQWSGKHWQGTAFFFCLVREIS